MKGFKINRVRVPGILTAFTALFIAGISASCDKSGNEGPVVRASVNKLGEYVPDRDVIYLKRRDAAVYRFDIMGRGSDIRKIELWQYAGTGINASEPVELYTWEYPAVEVGSQFTVSSSSLGADISVNRDVQYSVYVEDMDGNYTSKRVQIFVDVFSFELSSSALYTGNTAATSSTFLNLQSGRTLPVGQTIADPAGIDLGFAWLGEDPAANPAEACLVSFDQYWKTGIYNMFANDMNGWVKFRKAPAMTAEEFDDINIDAEQLKDIYENAEIVDPPAGSGFAAEDERIAANIQEGDVYSITTRDGRHGLIRILRVDSSNKDSENVQLRVLITKK